MENTNNTHSQTLIHFDVPAEAHTALIESNDT